MILILILGFYLRVYHLDYPVVGYHNWKETHYLTEARNFAEDGFFEHGFFVPEWDYPALKEDSSGIHSDTLPTTSIIVGAGFKIFGNELWIARTINILFVLGSILFFYLIIKKLFRREDLALLSALLMSINPLLIFFGRQVQLINAALFFCLGGSYFFLKWLDDYSWTNTILFSTFLFLGIMTKYSFAIFLIPLLFTFPVKKIKEKKNWTKYLLIIIIGIIFLLWYPYSSTLSGNIGSQISKINVTEIFNGEFWIIMKSFFSDNYTLTGLYISLIGAGIFLLKFKKQINKKSYKFFLSYLIISIIWFIVLAEKLKGHNYHQYPIMPLIVFFTAYFFLFAGTTISKLFKIKPIKWIAITILFFLILIPSLEAKDRMFDTQFYGLDIAGEYVKEHKLSGERAMHSSHQAYGFLWHGDIKGTRGIPRTIEDIKLAEDNLNANWIFIYQWDFDIMQDPELSTYFQENYDLKQVAFISTPNGDSPLYFLLRKGGSFNISNLNELLSNKIVSNRQYELSEGVVSVSYVNI